MNSTIIMNDIETSTDDEKCRKIFKSSVQNHVNENTVTIKKAKLKPKSYYWVLQSSYCEY